MNALHPGTDESTLADRLAGIIGYLRMQRYGDVSHALKDALHGACDKFVRRLADHLRHEEEVLFPGLLEASPGSAAMLEEIRQEHRLLHIYARELGVRLRARDEDGAFAVARSFLGALFDHIQREGDAVDSIVRSLDEAAARKILDLMLATSGACPECRKRGLGCGCGP